MGNLGISFVIHGYVQGRRPSDYRGSLNDQFRLCNHLHAVERRNWSASSRHPGLCPLCRILPWWGFGADVEPADCPTSASRDRRVRLVFNAHGRWARSHACPILGFPQWVDRNHSCSRICPRYDIAVHVSLCLWIVLTSRLQDPFSAVSSRRGPRGAGSICSTPLRLPWELQFYFSVGPERKRLTHDRKFPCDRSNKWTGWVPSYSWEDPHYLFLRSKKVEAQHFRGEVRPSSVL